MRTIAALPFLLCLAGCQSDEPNMQVTVMNELTTGASRSWKIESATLSNAATGDVTLTNLANVNDDEFVFTANPSLGVNAAMLHWRVRNQVRAGATTAQEALLDYYISGIDRTLTIQSDGSITSIDPNLTVARGSNGKLSVQYLMNAEQFSMELVPAEEAAHVPALFDFEFVTDMVSTAIGLEQAAGFTGSMASNSLYFAYKAFESTPIINPERVVRYDIDEGTFTTINFDNLDFVTKELHIINDELKVVGARFVNTYPLDLGGDPVSVPHNLTITRYGSTVVDDNVFLFGGDLLFPTGSPGTPGPNADKIYRHDQATGQLTEVGALPEPRYWAHGEIVDGKLYVFGGRQAFIAEEPEDDIFVHDMATGENQVLKLPMPMHRTFAARYGQLVYVAGYREIPNADPALSTIETTFGVFDTHTSTFTVIPSSLTFTGKQTVFGFTIVGHHLYVLVGTWGVTNFSIYRAPLVNG
jgi:hypothetical protein